jgi:3-phosphoshikimate 1-carboxyvinyltransferase
MRAEPPSRAVTVEPAARVRGAVRVPGDKSIAHRYALLGALAEGTTRIARFAPGADCRATLECLAALGVEVGRAGAQNDPDAPVVELVGRGLGGLQAPAGPLDAANSATTLRLLAGVVAAHPFETILTGDQSLRRRPMRRIIVPLERMGARIAAVDGDRPPLVVRGGPLAGIDYAPEVASAQVKSAILLAGLHAAGTTMVRERVPTRDHTERALRAFGATVAIEEGGVALAGRQRLRAISARVPGDLSSAVFWAAAAAVRPGSEVELLDVGLNPTRTRVLDVLRAFGARVDVHVTGDEHGELRGRLVVRAGEPRGSLVIGPAEVPALIDELPALAALAASGGSLEVRGAGELRTKESDRISGLVAGLRALGADATELADGFIVRGRRLRGGCADAQGDHRLAMAFAVAALAAERPSTIVGAEAVDVSYPGFFDVLATLYG